MPPPSPQRVYFEVHRVSNLSNHPPETHSLSAWFLIVLALVLLGLGWWVREIGRRRSH